MKIFDTHCHYNLEPLHSDWPKYWSEAQKAGVKQALVVGASLHSSACALKIASSTPHLSASIGLHPTYFLENDEQDLNWHLDPEKDIAEIIALAHQSLNSHPSPLRAIGETGLEYFRLQDRPDFEQIRIKQIKLFNQQIDLANELHLPVVIHNRDAGNGQTFSDILEILRNNPPQAGFILHCFAGTPDYLKKGLALGAYISFAGNLTFKNAHELRSLVALVPPERLLVETDSPFLSPEPHRGQFCQPAFIANTLDYILYHFSQFSAEQIYANSCRFFSLEE